MADLLARDRSLASAKAAVGSTRAMLGRLSEPNKDSDPAIDGLQRPLRSTFRDFRFLRVHGTDAITASHGMHGMHDSHGMQCGHGIHGCHGIDSIHGAEGVYAGYGMGGIDAMDSRNSTSGINGVSGMDGTARERNGILLTDHSYGTETWFISVCNQKGGNYNLCFRERTMSGQQPRTQYAEALPECVGRRGGR